jgi:hypothetical protein
MSNASPTLTKPRGRHRATKIGVYLFVLVVLLYVADKVAQRGRHWIFGSLYHDHPYLVAAIHSGGAIFILAVLLAFFYFYTGAFKKQASETRWLKLTLVLMALINVPGLLDVLSLKSKEFIAYGPEPQVLRASVGTELVIALTTIGIAIYLFKKTHQVIYGFSEIIMAILSNIALIQSLDLTRFPKIPIQPSQVLAMGLFAYLLSAGIGNIAEGVEKMRAVPKAA